MPAVQPIMAGLFTTAIAAGNTCPFTTPSDWQRRALSHPSAESATPTIESVDAIGSRPLARALAETINGLYKTEVIRRRSSWKTMEEVALETLKWVSGSTTPRRFSRTCGVHLLDLLEPIGNKPPAEAEEAFHANLNTRDLDA